MNSKIILPLIATIITVTTACTNSYHSPTLLDSKEEYINGFESEPEIGENIFINSEDIVELDTTTVSGSGGYVYVWAPDQNIFGAYILIDSATYNKISHYMADLVPNDPTTYYRFTIPYYPYTKD